MTTVERSAREVRSIDVAGVAWPLYKLSSVGVGIVALVVALALTAPVTAAVLTGAAVAAIAWLIGAVAR